MHHFTPLYFLIFLRFSVVWCDMTGDVGGRDRRHGGVSRGELPAVHGGYGRHARPADDLAGGKHAQRESSGSRGVGAAWGWGSRRERWGKGNDSFFLLFAARFSRPCCCVYCVFEGVCLFAKRGNTLASAKRRRRRRRKAKSSTYACMYVSRVTGVERVRAGEEENVINGNIHFGLFCFSSTEGEHRDKAIFRDNFIISWFCYYMLKHEVCVDVLSLLCVRLWGPGTGARPFIIFLAVTRESSDTPVLSCRVQWVTHPPVVFSA